MSTLQEQAVRMICGLSDDNVSFLIEVMRRLMPEQCGSGDEKLNAFQRLDNARAEIKRYLPDDFDPDKELEEARAERYENIG